MEKERVERDEYGHIIIKRIDTNTNETHVFTVTDAEDCEEITEIMSAFMHAELRMRIFRIAFIAVCIVMALMIAAYVVRYEVLLRTIIAAGVSNLVFLERYHHWSFCRTLAMMRSEQFFERLIDRVEANELEAEEPEELTGC